MITMFLVAKVDRKTWPVRIVSYGLLFAIIFFFSLHSQLDGTIAKVSHSSIAKVKKDFRSYHGNGPQVALTPALADWIPTFHPSFLIVVNKQDLFNGHLSGSRQIRAPPSTYFLWFSLVRLNSKGFRVSFPIGRDGYTFCSNDNVNIWKRSRNTDCDECYGTVRDLVIGWGCQQWFAMPFRTSNKNVKVSDYVPMRCFFVWTISRCLLSQKSLW